MRRGRGGRGDEEGGEGGVMRRGKEGGVMRREGRGSGLHLGPACQQRPPLFSLCSFSSPAVGCTRPAPRGWSPRHWMLGVDAL